MTFLRLERLSVIRFLFLTLWASPSLQITFEDFRLRMPLQNPDPYIFGVVAKLRSDYDLMSDLIQENQNGISRFIIFTDGRKVAERIHNRFWREFSLIFLIDTKSEIHDEEGFVDFAQFYNFQWRASSVFFLLGRENIPRSTFGTYVLNLPTNKVSVQLHDNNSATFRYLCSHCIGKQEEFSSLAQWTQPQSLRNHYLREYNGQKVLKVQRFVTRRKKVRICTPAESSREIRFKCEMRFRAYRMLSEKHNFTYDFDGYKNPIDFWLNFIGGPYNKIGLQSGPSSTSGQLFYGTNNMHIIYCELESHNPDNNSLKLWVQPFTVGVWATVMSICITLGTLMVLKRDTRSYIKGVLEVISVFIRQQSERSGLLATVGIGGIFITTLYETMVTSIILVPVKDTSHETLQEMLELGYKFLYPSFGNGTLPGVEKVYGNMFRLRGLHSYLNTSFHFIPPTLEHERYSWLSPLNSSVGMCADLEDAIRVDYRLHLLYLRLRDYHHYTIDLTCHKVPEKLNLIHMYWDIKSSHRSVMSTTLRTLRESGLIQTWLMAQYWGQNRNVSISKARGKVRVFIRMIHLTGVLYLILGILVFATVVLVIELLGGQCSCRRTIERISRLNEIQSVSVIARNDVLEFRFHE